jgi:DNA-binding CsgD family transcriptional regulator
MKSVISQLPEISRLYYEEGLSVKQIAERLGCRVQSLYYHVSRRRIVFAKRTNHLDRDVLQELRVDRRLSVAKIARMLGTNTRHVKDELARLAVPEPSGPRRGELDLDQLRRLYVDEQLPAIEVAARMGTSREKVRRGLISAGIDIRQKGSVREYRITPQIKVGPRIQKLGLPDSAGKYNIRLDPKSVGGRTWLMVGMPEISRLYHSEGLTPQQIGNLLDVTRDAIEYHVRRGHISLEPRERIGKKKTLDENAVKELFIVQRLPVKQIARRLGCTLPVLSREIERMGLARPPLKPSTPFRDRSPVDETELRRLYETERLPVWAVAEELDLGVHVVVKEMDRIGIQRRRSPRKFPELASMKVGDSREFHLELDLARPTHAIYVAASRLGFKFRTRRIAPDVVLVTRIS